MKLKELRRTAIEYLTEKGNTSPHADVDLCLVSMLGFSKTDIIIGSKDLPEETCENLMSAVKRIGEGEPVQYVVGRCEFMSLDFKVNSSTLIPRADTEVLVETVMDFCKNKENAKIFEIGCGSGCISVSLAKYIENSTVWAIDISDGALKTASENAEILGVSEQTNFFKHDIMTGFPNADGDLDVVVSNPPYIPSRDIDDLEIKVKSFEPRTALDGGNDGLDFYRKISECAKLKEGGMLAFEVGFDQANEVAEIMSKCGYKNICKIKDLSGIERVVTGIRF